jgi:hypothetical protein
MLWLSRMKSLELLTWPLVVCCDCYRWRCRQGTWTYVVFVTNEIFGAVEMGPGGMLWLSSWRCWQGTWAYVVIVIDDAVDRAHGRMLWLSQMKSLELLKWPLVVCCDCHRWRCRQGPWSYVVIVIDDAVDRAPGRMLWLSSMTLLTGHMGVCCDCLRWRCRQGTWAYVVIVTNKIDGSVESAHRLRFWLP